MMAQTLAVLVALVRHRKWLLSIIGISVAVAFLPLFAYSPRCYEGREPTSVGNVLLATKYKQTLTDNLKLYGISHVSVHRLVLLQLWTWFVDPVSWVANASNQAVRHFIDEKYGASPENIPIGVLLMIEGAREPDGYIELECPLVRAVAIDGW